MRKPLTLSILLTAALGCSAMAFAAADGGQFAGHGGGGHGMHHGGGLQGLRKLDLSDAQKAQVKQIMRQGFQQLKPQFEAVRSKRKAFESLTPDQAGYQAAASDLAQAEAALTSARVIQRANSKAQIYALLTTSQKSQLASMRAEREARRQQWKQFQQQHPLPNAQ